MTSYRIAGNFRWVKFLFQVLKTSFRGLIFVLGLKCLIEKYTGPRRETQRTQQGLEVPEHRPSWQFSTTLELLQLASRPAGRMYATIIRSRVITDVYYPRLLFKLPRFWWSNFHFASLWNENNENFPPMKITSYSVFERFNDSLSDVYAYHSHNCLHFHTH